MVRDRCCFFCLSVFGAKVNSSFDAGSLKLDSQKIESLLTTRMDESHRMRRTVEKFRTQW